jgi:hypothetical protein
MIENYSANARVQDFYALLRKADSIGKSSFAIKNIAIHQIADNQPDYPDTSELNFNSLLK